MDGDFNKLGFLGNDLANWRNSVHSEFPKSFAIAYRMSSIGMEMINNFQDGEIQVSKILAIASFYRSLQSFQSAVLLAERGALAEARSLTRLCCEAVIVTAGLLKVEGTLEKLWGGNHKHRLSMSNKTIDLYKHTEKKTLEKELEEFKQISTTIKAQYSEKPEGIKYTSLAVQVNLEELYEISYRNMSGNGAHVTLGALIRHISKDEAEDFYQMIFHPDKSDLCSTLFAANRSLFSLLKLAQESMGLIEYKQVLCEIELQLFSINESDSQ